MVPCGLQKLHYFSEFWRDKSQKRPALWKDALALGTLSGEDSHFGAHLSLGRPGEPAEVGLPEGMVGLKSIGDRAAPATCFAFEA